MKNSENTVSVLGTNFLNGSQTIKPSAFYTHLNSLLFLRYMPGKHRVKKNAKIKMQIERAYISYIVFQYVTDDLFTFTRIVVAHMCLISIFFPINKNKNNAENIFHNQT